MIIDDDPGLQDAIGLGFNAGQYNVTTFGDANIIMAAVDIPDLIVLDKQLSGIDGTAVCRYLKSSDYQIA